MTSTPADSVESAPAPAGERPRLDVLVSAPFPSVRRGIASLLAEFPDLAPRTESTFDESVEMPQPDVVVIYQPSGAIGFDLVETAQSPNPLVLVVEGVLTELPDLSSRPIALLPAEVDGDTLHTAVLAVSQGLTVIDTTFAASAGISWRQPHVPHDDLPDQLTARETRGAQPRRQRHAKQNHRRPARHQRAHRQVPRRLDPRQTRRRKPHRSGHHRNAARIGGDLVSRAIVTIALVAMRHGPHGDHKAPTAATTTFMRYDRRYPAKSLCRCATASPRFPSGDAND